MIHTSTVDVRKFHAVGDGKTINTHAIQSAIDHCEDGGTVIITEGIYRSGAIFLKSSMTLCIAKGATLLGSEETADYPIMSYRFEGIEQNCYASLINTKNLNGEAMHCNIYIDGEGAINASGSILFQKEIEESKGKRGRAICIRNASHVVVRNIKIRQSPSWCLHLIYCEDILIHKVKIDTKQDRNGISYGICNGDGIDLDSCRNAEISHCYIDSEDDCIAIKSGKDEEGRRVGIPTEQVRIHDCEFYDGFGVAMGSEMSGGIRNVLVKDCTFTDTYSIASVKAPRGRGGRIENITYENCTHRNKSMEYKDCKWFRGAIYIDQFYSHDSVEYKREEPVTKETPTISNITFRNLSVDTCTGNAIFLAGLPENPLRNIRLENIRAAGKYGIKAYNIEGLLLSDVEIIKQEGKKKEMFQVTETDGFSQPQEEFTPIPFWFWNDVLEQEEIIRQIAEMKNKGIDAFVIHPRMGIPESIGYLSDTFMEYVKIAVKKACELNMKVVLYDEGMYPSGSANGKVVQLHPEFASKGLCRKIHKTDSKEETLVYEKGENYFYLVNSGGTIRGIHYGEEDGETGAPKSADLLNPKAVQCFIELTHEVYYKALKEYFGTTVIAMFTDEPDSLGRNAKQGLIPWTDDFMEYYLEHGGTKEALPLLFSQKDSAEKRQYEEIVNQRLTESYYHPLAVWCNSHGIGLTGHPQKSEDIGVLAEFTFPCQDIVWRSVAPENGSGIVGVDSTMAKCSSDAARHRGKRRNGNECLGCCSLPQTPYSFSKDDMKWYLDWLFVRGVNLIYPHAFFYSILGQRQAERPPDVGLHSEFWEAYHEISDYIKRMCWLLTDCVNQAKVAVICRSNQLSDTIVRSLYENQLEFNYLEEELLPRCKVQGQQICIANQRYEAIVLDKAFFYRKETYQHIREWKAKNIPVIWAGEKQDQVYDAILSVITPDIRLKEKERNLRMTHIRKGEKDFVIATNEGETEIHAQVRFSFGKVAELWDAQTGKKEKLPKPEETMMLRIGRRKSIVLVMENKFH